MSATRAAWDTGEGRERRVQTWSRGGPRTPKDQVRDTRGLWARRYITPGAEPAAEGGALRLDAV